MIYIIKVWKFIKGYVIIKISGFNINKFINRSLKNDVKIFDLHNHSSKYYKGYVHISQLEDIKAIANKNNCNIAVESPSIADVIKSNIKYKLVYVFGLIAFMLIIFFSSQLVWIIDIEGNRDLSKDEIIKFCDKNNLYVGCPIKALDGKALADNLKNTYKNISWVNISLDGTRVHIKLAEGTENTKEYEDNIPCDIIADKDGIISDIVTDKGTPIVKKNDVVQKGDILISGILKNSGTEEIVINDFVHSKGTVKAYVNNNYSFNTPLRQSNKVYTGEEQNKYRIKLWKIDICDNNKISYKNYDYFKSIKQLKIGEDIPLPITLYKYTYKEYNYKENIIDIKTAEDISYKKIISYIVDNYPVTSDVISCKVSYKQNKNNLEVNAYITSNEIIGVEHSIEQSGGNLLNDTTEAANTH